MRIYFGNFKVVKNYPIHPLPPRCILYLYVELNMYEHLHTCVYSHMYSLVKKIRIKIYKQLRAGGRREDAFSASIIS